MVSICPIRISFPMTPVRNVVCGSLHLLKRIGAMDTAKVVIGINPSRIEKFVSAGSPMLVTWGESPLSDTFRGYVHSYRESTDNHRKSVEMLLISAAYPMAEQSRRSFTRVPVHHVVENIADSYRFSLDADYHPLIREQVLQGELSDWEFLQRMSSDWGYVGIFDETTIIFRRQENYIRSKYVSAVNTSLAPRVGEKNSSLRYFRPSFSATGTTPISISSGYGVDPATGSIFRWRQPGTGVFAASPISRTVTTLYETEFVAAVEQARTRFPFVAEATVMSPFGCSVYDCYRIEDAGKTMTWSVLSAMHEVVDGEYQAKLILGSDGGDQALTPNRTNLQDTITPPRSEPYIAAAQSYYTGSGASVLVDDQRWKSRVRNVKIRKED